MPLVVATGAGANSRQSLEIVILGGILASAVVGTLLTPSFYTLVQSIKEKLKGNSSESKPQTAETMVNNITKKREQSDHYSHSGWST